MFNIFVKFFKNCIDSNDPQECSNDPDMTTLANKKIIPSTENGLHNEKIVILDAGSQYAKMIDRLVRELKVETDILPLDTPTISIRKYGYKGIIISGGPNSIYAEDAPKYYSDLFKLNIPILGICYGMHIINIEFGGTVHRKDVREDGQQEIELHVNCPLFRGLVPMQSVLLTHGDSINKVGDHLTIAAMSKNKVVHAFYNDKRKVYGVQFHPEVNLTVNGKQMLSNFLYNICEVAPTYTMTCRTESCIKYIKDNVGKSKVLVLVSGGVDSTVCATLLRKALPPQQIIAVHIDHGFLRKNESEIVEKSLRAIGIDLIVKHCFNAFFKGTTMIKKPDSLYYTESQMLCLTTSPEEKRNIIGDTFVKLTNSVLRDLKLNPEDVFLAQGTLRPDLIESASSTVSKTADTIKTHHNDTAMIRTLRRNGRVIEPLSEFHKDEVREIGRSLGLPSKLVDRHPFPGPGLAIRIICAEDAFLDNDYSETQVIARVIVDFSNKQEKNHALLSRVANCTSADEQAELRRISRSTQIVATVLPIRSVGVQGDHRTYSYVVGLSTPDNPNWKDLLFLAKIIPRILHNVNRVCYVFDGIVEYQITDVTHTRICKYALSQLRFADSIVNETLEEFNCTRHIAQMPVVLIPIHFDRDPTLRIPSCSRSIVLRPFLSNDFMTGVPVIPGTENLPIPALDKMVHDISELDGISRVLYDLTSKPPGTTEWE